MDLLFSIKNQELVRIDNNLVASYSKNYITCLFDFEAEDWGSLYKQVLFVDSKGTKYVVDLGYSLQNRCNIPDDVLKGNYFKVSVFAGDRITSTQEKILVHPSGYNDKITHIENTADNDNVKIIKYCDDKIDYRRIRLLFDDEDIIPITLNRWKKQEHLYQ